MKRFLPTLFLVVAVAAGIYPILALRSDDKQKLVENLLRRDTKRWAEVSVVAGGGGRPTLRGSVETEADLALLLDLLKQNEVRGVGIAVEVKTGPTEKVARDP